MQSEQYATDARYVWAFAIDTANRQRRSRRQAAAPRRALQRYTITACSPRAKALGVRQGMPYSQARQLAPDLRVIICNR